MKILSQIENENLVLSHKWTDWMNPNTVMESKWSTPTVDIKEILEIKGPKGGFKGLYLLSKKENSYSTSHNGEFETYNETLKSYSHYDRDAKDLFEELKTLFKDYSVEFKTITK